jgi:hypothetical protein
MPYFPTLFEFVLTFAGLHSAVRLWNCNPFKMNVQLQKGLTPQTEPDLRGLSRESSEWI